MQGPGKTDLQLSPHFRLWELTHSDTADAHKIDNTPPSIYLPRLIEVANMLERVRTALGNVAITVSSGYRCPELNKLVGGQPASDHQFGYAADFEAPEFGSPFHIASFLAPQVQELGIGQMIYEGVSGKRWVHISTREVESPINRVITIHGKQTLVGIVGIPGEDIA
jgi:hypothetical protein